ncbi:MAG: hypothetical protein EA374_02625 [Acholeplasmatales bacterium]|nr:MAG: hypothetical protein EA374_02625 [Acholeplasmatales bacterium]
MQTSSNNLFPASLFIWASIIMFGITLVSSILQPDLAIALNLRIFIVPSAAIGVMLTLTTPRRELYQNERRRWIFCLVTGLLMTVLPLLVSWLF